MDVSAIVVARDFQCTVTFAACQIIPLTITLRAPKHAILECRTRKPVQAQPTAQSSKPAAAKPARRHGKAACGRGLCPRAVAPDATIVDGADTASVNALGVLWDLDRPDAPLHRDLRSNLRWSVLSRYGTLHIYVPNAAD